MAGRQYSALDFELFPLPDPEEGLDAFAGVTEQDRRDARAEQEASDLTRALLSLRRRYLEVKADHQERGGAFGSKDAHVDTLTRAAQIDLRNADQLFALALHEKLLEPEHLKITRGEIQGPRGTQERDQSRELKWLQELRDSAAVAYLLLSDLAEGLISADVVFWINEHCWESTVYFTLLPDEHIGPANEGVSIAHLTSNRFVRGGGGIKADFSEIIRRLLDRIMMPLMMNPPKSGEVLAGRFAARCEECESPFVVVKKGQRFCSPRCNSRSGQRRRRSEKAA